MQSYRKATHCSPLLASGKLARPGRRRGADPNVHHHRRRAQRARGADPQSDAVILPREAWSAWLGEEQASAAELQALLEPFLAELMRAYPVRARVNSVKTDKASVFDAITA
jgi:hypothetical protein